MRHIWLAITILCFAVPASAFWQSRDSNFNVAISGGSGPVCPANDGSSGAPLGTKQHPTILSGYTRTIHELGCLVAGVDYPVGYPSGTVLKDWQTLCTPSCPAGISLNTSANPGVVNCTNTSNVTLNGVDFSLHGGATFNAASCPNATVTNSNFGGVNLVNSCSFIVKTDTASTGFTFTYNVLDGAGQGSATCGGADTEVALFGGGTNTIQYNWIKNFPAHAFAFGSGAGTGTATVNYRYNLIEAGAQTPGAHLNFQQLNGDPSTPWTFTTQFNTTYMNNTANQPGGEGIQWTNCCTAGTNMNLVSPNSSYNTMISLGANPPSNPEMSYLQHGTVTGTTSGSPVTTGNYYDVTSAFGAYYPGTWSAWSCTNNVNMVTGATISCP